MHYATNDKSEVTDVAGTTRRPPEDDGAVQRSLQLHLRCSMVEPFVREGWPSEDPLLRCSREVRTFRTDGCPGGRESLRELQERPFCETHLQASWGGGLRPTDSDYQRCGSSFDPDAQRRTLVPIVYGKYRKLDQNRIKGQADLIYIDGIFYLMLVIDLPEEKQIENPDGTLGVDLGIVNLATTSDGVRFSGEKCEAVRKRYLALRARLQSVGTWDAKKHLKRISRKERRFKKTRIIVFQSRS